MDRHNQGSVAMANVNISIGQHPLMNSVILQNILEVGNLAVADLKTFRLVCHGWYKESLGKWRRTALLHVKGPNSDDTKPWEIDVGLMVGSLRHGLLPIDKLSRYLDMSTNVSLSFQRNCDKLNAEATFSYDLRRKPFTSIKLSRCQIFLDEMWNKIGPHLEHLHFKECKFVGALGPDVILSKIVFESCPKLKLIKVENCDFDKKNSRELPRHLLHMTENQMKSELLGYQEHQSLESVSITGLLPEKLILVLTLARKLNNYVIHLSNMPQILKDERSERDSHSRSDSVTQCLGEKMIKKLKHSQAALRLEFEQFLENFLRDR